MSESNQQPTIDLSAARRTLLSDASQDLIERLKSMSDDDLLRASGTLDLFAGVEANRRLRVALQREERVIVRLTWWLVALTGTLVVLTIVLVVVGLRTV
jgi:hypothetical protein